MRWCAPILASWLLCAASVAAGDLVVPLEEERGLLDVVAPGKRDIAALDDAINIITPPPRVSQASPTSFAVAQHIDNDLAPQPTQPPAFEKRQLDNPQEAINAASRSAQQAVASASQSAAEAVRQAQEMVRRAQERADQAIAQATRDANEASRQARQSADQAIAAASRGADERVRQADQSAQQVVRAAQESARQEIDRSFSMVQAARADVTAVRKEATLQVQDAQGSAISTTQIALAITGSVAGGSILSVIIFWLVVRRRRAKAREAEEQAAAGAVAYARGPRKSDDSASVMSRQTEWKEGRSVTGELDSWLRQTRNDTSAYGGARGQTAGSVSGATVRSTNWPFRQSRGPSR